MSRTANFNDEDVTLMRKYEGLTVTDEHQASTYKNHRIISYEMYTRDDKNDLVPLYSALTEAIETKQPVRFKTRIIAIDELKKKIDLLLEKKTDKEKTDGTA